MLHVLSGSGAGGLIRYVADLAAAMIAQGHDVMVAGERGEWHYIVEEQSVPWLEVPLNSGPMSLLKARNVLQEHLRTRPRPNGPILLHAHHRKSAIVARRLKKAAAGPLLFTLHLPNIPMNFPWGFLSDWGDITHVASEEARDWMIKVGQAPDKIRLLYHGINTKRFPIATEADRIAARRKFGLSPDQRVIAWVGRFDIPKNETWMVDLAKATERSMPDLHILIAGDGPGETPLRQLIAQQGQGSRITLLGHVPPLPVYQACDAMLLSSGYEGFSFVTAEAMSVGRPVLRTIGGGCKALIVEGVTGRSSAIDKEKFIAAAIGFMSDPAALRVMGAHAADHIRKHFTYDRQLEGTYQLYSQMLARNT